MNARWRPCLGFMAVALTVFSNTAFSELGEDWVDPSHVPTELNRLLKKTTCNASPKNESWYTHISYPYDKSVSLTEGGLLRYAFQDKTQGLQYVEIDLSKVGLIRMFDYGDCKVLDFNCDVGATCVQKQKRNCTQKTTLGKDASLWDLLANTTCEQSDSEMESSDDSQYMFYGGEEDATRGYRLIRREAAIVDLWPRAKAPTGYFDGKRTFPRRREPLESASKGTSSPRAEVGPGSPPNPATAYVVGNDNPPMDKNSGWYQLCNGTHDTLLVAALFMKETGLFSGDEYFMKGWYQLKSERCLLAHDSTREKMAAYSVWRNGKLFPAPTETEWSERTFFGEGVGYKRIDAPLCVKRTDSFTRTTSTIEEHRECPPGYSPMTFNLQVYHDSVSWKYSLDLQPDRIKVFSNR